jgi:hypothetical protein
MSEKIGPLDKDTVIVLGITGLSSAVILTLTGILMLANMWSAQAEPDRVRHEYVPSHGHHGDDHGGGHH